MEKLLSEKQLKFILEAKAQWNLAHGAVRTGKTVGSLFAFLHHVNECPDDRIYMVGHSSETIYDNAIRLIFETDQFAIFRPYCIWQKGKRELLFKDKVIRVMGAKDEGSLSAFTGKTMSLVYCDEMVLYPVSIINMLDTRLSLPHSKGFATMNPGSPSHILKEWIDKAEEGNPNYYALHFTLDDNPYVPEDYKQRIRNSLSGVFYKRNYLGLWCLAEGSIFDFFDRSVHCIHRPPAAADYFIAGIDYGVSNAFACLVVGVNRGLYTQTAPVMWVEKEYYWDSKKMERQKTNFEFTNDIIDFLEPYGVKQVYIDPSALSIKVDLQRKGLPMVDAYNDVLNGIQIMTSDVAKGKMYVLSNCKNLIREIENYVWDPKKSAQGEDAPIKKADHAVDALRYICASHKIVGYNPYSDTHDSNRYQQNRFDPGMRRRF